LFKEPTCSSQLEPEVLVERVSVRAALAGVQIQTVAPSPTRTHFEMLDKVAPDTLTPHVLADDDRSDSAEWRSLKQWDHVKHGYPGDPPTTFSKNELRTRILFKLAEPRSQLLGLGWVAKLADQPQERTPVVGERFAKQHVGSIHGSTPGRA
jgi:hypothetical protein